MEMVETGVVRRPLRLGLCAVCGTRVFKNQRYIEAQEGHAHRECVLEVSENEV